MVALAVKVRWLKSRYPGGERPHGRERERREVVPGRWARPRLCRLTTTLERWARARRSTGASDEVMLGAGRGPQRQRQVRDRMLSWVMPGASVVSVADQPTSRPRTIVR
jgi:hypothetical protein